MSLKKLYLKKNEERRINAGHLWIYSNEIDTTRSPLKNFVPGEVIEILSSRERFLGVGYINPHALISARILSRTAITIDGDFFVQRIQTAQNLRETFFPKPFYRLVYAESDRLPGLIIDRYDSIFVVQMNTLGIENQKNAIVEALNKLYNPSCILLKNDSHMRQLEGLQNYIEVVSGEAANACVEENHCRFEVPLLEGQKTGWFYDHRDNRARLERYVKNRNVLDVFCYLGAWGIQAAHYGAKEVTCIDSSERAINAVMVNARLNNFEKKIKTYKGDAFDTLKQLTQEKRKFDVIVLDPPALIKKRKDMEQGRIAYLRLNELALQLINNNGILVSCSCSMHMTQTDLLDTIRRAGVKTKKNIQILEIGFQDLDHPLHPAIPETGYLKAFYCLVCDEL